MKGLTILVISMSANLPLKITKVVKPFIRRGANTFGSIVCVCVNTPGNTAHSDMRVIAM